MAESPARTRVRVLELNQDALTAKVAGIQTSLVATQDYVATVPDSLDALAEAIAELGTGSDTGSAADKALQDRATALETRCKAIEDKQKAQDTAIASLNFKVFGIKIT